MTRPCRGIVPITTAFFPVLSRAVAGMVKADLTKRAMKAADLESPAAKQAVDALFKCLDSALEPGDRVVQRRDGM